MLELRNQDAACIKVGACSVAVSILTAPSAGPARLLQVAASVAEEVRVSDGGAA